jgi:hypothetical protein
MKLKPLALGLGMAIFFFLMMIFIHFYPAISESIFGTASGVKMKELFEDLYPFYGEGTWCSNCLGFLFALIDGFIFGVLVAALYNFSGKFKK